ncbi:MAG: homoaconitate hydratase [bacterium]
MKGIIDTTLREGEQSAHVYFNLAEKLHIIGLLDRVGIDEIEAGVAVMNPETRELFRQVRELFGQGRDRSITPLFSLWCRCQASDIDETLNLSPDILSMSIPVSDIHIKKKLGRNRSWVLARVSDSIKQAKDTAPSCYLSLGLEDASRADFAFVEEVCSRAQEEGINRIRFADTVGIMDPLTMVSTITRLKAFFKVDLGVHTHNDFGMATANAVSALASGADFVDVTVNGIGERAGNAALEEVITFMAKRKGVDTYDLKPLRFLSDYVARASGSDIPPRKPIVGKDIFTCESGIHLDGLMKHPSTYEPYDPAEVCMERTFLVSKKAGKSALRHKLESLGLKTEGHLLVELLTKVKDESSRLKTDLTDEELLHLYAMQQDSVDASNREDGGRNNDLDIQIKKSTEATLPH